MSTQTIRQMPKGAGKAEVAMGKVPQLLDQDAPISGMLIFHRKEIEMGDQPGLMDRLGPQAPAQDLCVIAGSSILAVDGYAKSPQEIYEIAEVREYFQNQNKIWSPWLFAGSIFTPDLFALVLTCLPTVSCWRSEGEIYVRWKEEDMRAFLQTSLPTAAWLHNRGGVKKERGCALLKAAAAYLGLPFAE